MRQEERRLDASDEERPHRLSPPEGLEKGKGREAAEWPGLPVEQVETPIRMPLR